MSEISDTEFLDRIVENEDFDPTADELDRLIALARRGAAATGAGGDGERVERVAPIFYNLFAFGGPGAKPDWVPKGNSLMQDEARKLARQAITAINGGK